MPIVLCGREEGRPGMGYGRISVRLSHSGTACCRNREHRGWSRYDIGRMGWRETAGRSPLSSNPPSWSGLPSNAARFAHLERQEQARSPWMPLIMFNEQGISPHILARHQPPSSGKSRRKPPTASPPNRHLRLLRNDHSPNRTPCKYRHRLTTWAAGETRRDTVLSGLATSCIWMSPTEASR